LPNPSLPVVSGDIWEFPVQGGLVLARPDFQGLFILNHTASAIWHLLREGLPSGKIAETYASLFSLPVARAAADVEAAITGWRTKLLSSGSAAPADPPIPDSSRRGFVFTGDYSLLATHLRLRLNTQELVEEIVPRLQSLAPAAAVSPPGFCFDVIEWKGRISVLCNSRELAREDHAGAARAILLEEMVRVAEPGRHWLAVLHAGACGRPAASTGSPGSCALFAGSSHSGKTTLAVALMYDGLELFSDDSAAIDNETLEIPAMPFAFMLREGSWPVLQPRYPQLETNPVVCRYGQRVRFLAPDPDRWPSFNARANTLLFTRYEPGSPTMLTPIPSLSALLKLQESGFWVEHTPGQITRFLRWLESIPAYTLHYSDLEEAVLQVRSAAGM
jgi:Coenzyme PQQ synthesis protein D (PqqD)